MTTDSFTTKQDVISQWVYSASKTSASGIPNSHRHKVGYLVAAKNDDGVIHIGWSKCSREDVFSPKMAKRIAYGRLNTGTDMYMPASFKRIMPEFILRCKKFFRSDEVEEITFFPSYEINLYKNDDGVMTSYADIDYDFDDMMR